MTVQRSSVGGQGVCGGGEGLRSELWVGGTEVSYGGKWQIEVNYGSVCSKHMYWKRLHLRK